MKIQKIFLALAILITSVSFGQNNITGTGTTNYFPKFTSSGTLGNSTLFESGGALQTTLPFSANGLWLNNYFSYCHAIGDSAFGTLTSGYNGVAIGVNSGRYATGNAALTSVYYSTYLGAAASPLNTTSSHELVIGGGAQGLGNNTTVIGSNNTNYGRWYGNLLLGSSTNSGEQLQVTGTSRFTGNTTVAGILTTNSDVVINGIKVGTGSGGVANVRIGDGALNGNTSGYFNVAIGNSTLYTGNIYNTVGIGSFVLQSALGSGNTAVGSGAGSGITGTGGENVLFGASAASNGTNFNQITAIGTRSLQSIVGNRTIGLGTDSGRYYGGGTSNLTSGDDSIFIGYNSQALANAETNQIVIGTNAVGLGSNTTVIGNSSTQFGRWNGALLLNTNTWDGTSQLTTNGNSLIKNGYLKINDSGGPAIAFQSGGTTGWQFNYSTSQFALADAGYGVYAMRINDAANGNNIILDKVLNANSGLTSTTGSFSSTVTASSFIKTGGTSSQFLKADGSIDSTVYQPLLTNSITGTGTSTGGYLPVFNGSNTLENSYLYQNNGTLAYDSTLPVFVFAKSGVQNAFVGDTSLLSSGNDFGIYTYGSRAIRFFTNGGSERARFADGGRLLVNTTTDNGSDQVQVNGSISTTGNQIAGGNVVGFRHLLGTAGGIMRVGSNILLSATDAGDQPLIKGAYNEDTVILPARDDNNNVGNVVIRGGGAVVATFASTDKSLSVTGNITGTSFIKTGGTSSQFLKADGSVDNTTYHPLEDQRLGTGYSPSFLGLALTPTDTYNGTYSTLNSGYGNYTFNSNGAGAYAGLTIKAGSNNNVKFQTNGSTIFGDINDNGSGARVQVNGSISATGGTSTNWNTAYGWGNHAGLYPTLTGTGATGTWGINITGSSTTATNADKWGGITADIANYGSQIDYLFGRESGTSTAKGYSAAAIKSWLGLGSTAYQPLLSLTSGYITKATGTSALGNSLIYDNGVNVGIGTINPDEKLTVKGKIHAEEIRVDLNVPADYVFQKYYTGTSNLKADYVMPTLAEVAQFTKDHNHLPNIPSAKEMKEKGVELGTMNNLLLQKIEELTLYVIEQQKEIQLLKEKINK